MDFPNTSSTNTAHKENCLPSWSLMMVAAPELPSPSDWGWKRKDTGGWKLTLPEKLPRHAVNSSSVGVQQGKMQMCQGITSVSALCHCGGLCSHNLFAYLIFNFCSLGAIFVVASILKIVPLHSPFIKM